MNAEIEKKFSDKSQGELEELIALVPKDKKKKAENLVAVVQSRITSFSGPLPPPECFEQYEQVLPGSAERILAMAEKQQNHRIEQEKFVLSKKIKISGRGQIFGFIALILLIGVSVLFMCNDMKEWAGVLSTVTLATIVGLFINGKINNQKQ